MPHHLKTVIKNTLYKAIAIEPILNHLRKTRLNNKIIVLMYHEIVEDDADIEAWTVVKRATLSGRWNIYLSILILSAFKMLSNK